MNDQGEDFGFHLGESKITEGIDNYQFQQISTAFSQELDEITGFYAESVVVCYGEYETVLDEKGIDIISMMVEIWRKILQDELRELLCYVNQAVNRFLYRR
ncbi:MAG: hypothetical protein V8S38_04905 [Lachnospiraceae bacterium]